jgi:hypothetical protein
MVEQRFHIYKKDEILNADKVVGVMEDVDKIIEKLKNGEISLETHEIEQIDCENCEGSY